MDERVSEKLPDGLRLKIRGLVPAITAIQPAESGDIPGLPETVGYWTGEERPSEEWFGDVEERWGSPGLVMRRGPEVLGYAVYAPAEHLPRAMKFPVGPVSRDAVVLAYASGDARVRKHLLVRALREMRLRGAGTVEALGSDAGLAQHHLSTGHLVESGWEPVVRGRYRGLSYTLTRLELGSAIEVGDLARDLLGRVKMPSFGRSPAPETRGGYVGSLSRFRGSRTSRDTTRNTRECVPRDLAQGPR
jgi:hypothetical protein